MNKLKLEIDALVVDSFPTADRVEAAGTVHGRVDADVPRESDTGDIAITPPTWARTCPYTCWDTCQITCVTGCSCITLPCAGCA
jgi:hypothetical protein